MTSEAASVGGLFRFKFDFHLDRLSFIRIIDLRDVHRERAKPTHTVRSRPPFRNFAAVGDQYTFLALASSSRAIISYFTGKRDSGNTHEFVADLRERVIGLPEISTDGFKPYQNAIRAEFGNRIAHGVVDKTYSVTHIGMKEAARRYSPAQVVAVARDVPAEISTSYVERSNLTLRMSSKRFARLSNGFSKQLENHRAAVSLYVAHYNLCRVHESLRSTPAMAIGVADRVWTVGDLLDAALATHPIDAGHDRAGSAQAVSGN
jgi:IS1 family transposase